MEQSSEHRASPPVVPNRELSRTEHEQIERRSAPRAAVVYETIRREGEEELQRPLVALAWSGLAAGSVTFGAYLGNFLLPGLLGNIIGGVTLVALLNYGQVLPQREASLSEV